MKVNMETLPDDAVEYILKLRREAAQYRNQRNDARADLEAAGFRIAELEAELTTARADVG